MEHLLSRYKPSFRPELNRFSGKVFGSVYGTKGNPYSNHGTFTAGKKHELEARREARRRQRQARAKNR